MCIRDRLGPGAPNSGMALSMFPDARALAQACWKEELSMVFTPAQLAALRAARPEDYTARLAVSYTHLDVYKRQEP